MNAEVKTIVRKMVTKTSELAEMVTQTDAGEAQVTGMPVLGEKAEGQVVVEGTRVAGS